MRFSEVVLFKNSLARLDIDDIILPSILY